MLNAPGKCQIFKNFMGWGLWVNFPLLTLKFTKQICKIINISRRIVSLQTIRDYNFKSELKWFVRSNFGVATLKKPMFKLKWLKKYLDLKHINNYLAWQAFIYEKCESSFRELFCLNYIENTVFCLKVTLEIVKGTFFLRSFLLSVLWLVVVLIF